jgi:hypothetical protein
MTHSDIAAALTGKGMITKYTGGRDRPSPDEIAHLAYHFYETRDRHDGHDVDDWYLPNGNSRVIIGRPDLSA